MTSAQLIASLSHVKWDNNVNAFCRDVANVERFEGCNARLAIWSKEIEDADRRNLALPFVREMQSSGHSVPALTALAMYKAAAAGMRTVLESALYYTYFRSHPVEMATLVRVPEFYASKNDIIGFHNTHTDGFKELQVKLGLVSELTTWYSATSAVIHGQRPGAWG